MKLAHVLALACALTCMPTAAHAQNVLIVRSVAGGELYDLEEQKVRNLKAMQEARGHTVTIATEVPENFADYLQIWDVKMGTQSTDEQGYEMYLIGGGNLYLTGLGGVNMPAFAYSMGGGALSYYFPPFGVTYIETLSASFQTPNALALIPFRSSWAFIGKGTGEWITQDAFGRGSSVLWERGTLSQAMSGRLFAISNDDFLYDDAPVEARQFTENLIEYSAAPRTTVPEPSTYALMAAGLGALLAVSHRRRNSARIA